MNRVAVALVIAVAIFGELACKKQANDRDAIRAGILQHLTAISTLNMSAMDMDIRSVSVNGNQAHAEVEFRPKTGGGPGGGMQVAYDLEKRDGAWVVLKSQPLGGMIQHPDPNQNPHENLDGKSGLYNFNDILKRAGTAGQSTLAPSHPQVNTQQPNSQPSGPGPSSNEKASLSL